MRERGEELKRDEKRVLKILQEGGAEARSSAEKTMKEVRLAMGLGSSRS